MRGYWGIDVAKAELVVAEAAQGESTKYPNTAAGHRQFLHVLEAASPQLIVVEATGGYEREVVAQNPVVVVVAFYKGQEKAFETAPFAVTEGMHPKSKAVPLGFSLALNKLQPGRYNCQVTVVDTTGQKAAFWQAPVMLVQ